MATNNGFLVSDLINEALGHLGVYTGDPLSAADMQTAFNTFLFLMDGWPAEPLTIFQKGVLSFTTTPGQQSYTLGVNTSGATYAWPVAALPSSYDSITAGAAPGSGLELPVRIVEELAWSGISIKGLSSSILAEMWLERLATSHTLNFWPLPSTAIPVNLYVSQRIPTFTGVTNSVALPEGYQEAIIFELAIKLSSKFSAPIPAWIPDAWKDAKGKITARNFPALDMRVDSALVRRSTRLGGSLAFYEGK